MPKQSIFAMHSAYKTFRNDDVVAIKEAIVNNETGERTSNLRLFLNPEREFAITKEKYRNHLEKKEDEDLRKCNVYKTTQRNMAGKIAKVLRTAPKGLRDVCSSPFVYGADVHVTSVIMDKYRKRFGEPTILPEVAVMDYEWDIAPNGKAGSASIGTFGYNNNVHLTIREDKITACGLTKEQYLKLMYKGFDEHVLTLVDEFYKSDKGKDQVKRQFKLHIDIVRLDIDVIKKLFSYTHVYQPDFLAFWNGISDLTVIEEHCQRRFVDMGSFMADPNIPNAYATTEIIKGPQGFKLDAKGQKKKIDYFNEWHTLDNFATWQYVDMMHSYATNRDHLPNLPTYGMDVTLDRDLGMGKLHLVAEVSTKDMGKWHTIMSTKHIVEYSLYATFDVIGPILLEDKQHEIGGQFFPKLNLNPINTYKSNPRQLATKMHFELKCHGRVVGSTGKSMTHPIDNLIYSGDGWIITLDTHYHAGMTGQVLSDAIAYSLYIPQAADIDLKSSYPMNQRMLNGSRGTTVTEMCSINGMTIDDSRMFGLNLSAGNQNHLLLATDYLGLPSLMDLVSNHTVVALG